MRVRHFIIFPLFLAIAFGQTDTREIPLTETISDIEILQPMEQQMTPEEAEAWRLIYEALEKSDPSDISESDIGQFKNTEKQSDAHKKVDSSAKKAKNSECDSENVESDHSNNGKHSEDRPPGWDNGEKNGWGDGNVPPGQRKNTRKRGKK
jgi:hypothetical protein